MQPSANQSITVHDKTSVPKVESIDLTSHALQMRPDVVLYDEDVIIISDDDSDDDYFRIKPNDTNSLNYLESIALTSWKRIESGGNLHVNTEYSVDSNSCTSGLPKYPDRD